ncbi:MAG: TonB-dependent receptor [Opitutaceae bacterium]|nr:TonB-dependent receptor [Opitutaceae bacterium]
MRPRYPSLRSALTRNLLVSIVCLIWSCLPSLAPAQDSAKRDFNVPSDVAEKTLNIFSGQSGRGLIVGTDLVKGVKTNAVNGQFTPREALDQMLAGTGFVASEDEKNGAFTVRKAAPVAPADPNADRGAAEAGSHPAQNSATERAPAPPPTARSQTGTAAGNPTSDSRTDLTGATADETVVLPAFTVKSDNGNAYHPTAAVSVARIASDIITSPMTVHVISQELINDLGANAAYDVTRYFSGVSNGRGSGAGGIGDRQNFRGFENFTRSIDNFSSALLPLSGAPQANWDPAFIERTELVMGPDSILSPSGSPGGSINIITKSPSFERASSLSQSIGNYNAGKTIFDSTGPIGNSTKLAYRIIADYQDARQYLPGSLRQSNLSLQLTYLVSPASKLSLKYFGEDWELNGAIADTNDNGQMVYTPDTIGATISSTPQPGFSYNGPNGDAAWSHRVDRLNILQAEFTTAIFDKISARFGAQVTNDKFTQDAGYPYAMVIETFDPATGLVTALTPTFPVTNGEITSMPMVAYFSRQEYRGFQLQNDYAGNFHLGSISIQPVVGWAYLQGTTPKYLTAGTPFIAPADLTAGYYNEPHPSFSDYYFVSDRPATGKQEQFYAATRVGLFDDRLLLSAGVSRSWVDINAYETDNGNALTPIGPYSDLKLVSQTDNYLAGALYRFTDQISGYYSFSTNAAVTSDIFGQPVWQTGKQHEFGIKGEFFNRRLLITADHFQISESNLTSTNPLYNIDPAHQPPVITYDAVNHGYELNVVGGLTENLSVILSGTNMRYRDTFGRRYRNVPDKMANLLLNYHFSSGALKDLSVFAGVVHVGQTAGESNTDFTSLGVPEQPSFFVPAWTVVNAGAGYKWGRFNFNLNVDNLLDKRFWWQPAGRNSVSPYPGLTVRFTTRILF